ncbi:META domain-containing protein [Vibrio sp. AND4]|uniref:META domain-containing protein n=1 Tax=Vibrio sp. AND4 TaxID=314289 RepID=UPI00015F2FBB|nr:META domain-containing protein [Vibrio sp. AND4]EDP60813.1 hypothetical protein AND4_07834 [Vibrio sp. AND4]
MKRLFLSLKILVLSFLVLPGAQAFEDSELPLLHQQLLGTWKLVQINNQPSLYQPNLRITQDNISGNTGCNNFFASIVWLDQGVWEITPVLTTRKGCKNPDLQMHERNVLKTLVTGAGIEFDEASDRLTLEVDDHSLTYQKES